ncbi:hypothetical protein EVAR_63057_1 [Eumeta japonica]|uniref:Uncharacterized protein n=1 Tax=Eumeta variegata TaxID=151549 RepID=A0A4C1Z7U7_EUMVA|nr:hypothetical protein EVAR_63057_1 [Eumeta japonica]
MYLISNIELGSLPTYICSWSLICDETSAVGSAGKYVRRNIAGRGCLSNGTLCTSKPLSAYPDIGHPLLQRIESRHRMTTESRTEPWLESSAELKLEPRTCSESEVGTVPRSEIRAGLLNPNLLSPRSGSELKAGLRSKSKVRQIEPHLVAGQLENDQESTPLSHWGHMKEDIIAASSISPQFYKKAVEIYSNVSFFSLITHHRCVLADFVAASNDPVVSPDWNFV